MTQPVAVTGLPEQGSAGLLIRSWRDARGLSQLKLALHAGVSARHLSFIESGRALPGRDVLLRLGRALDLPLREVNQLLESGSFAPLHPPRAMTDPTLAIVREVFGFLLERHEPNSAVVVDETWRVVLHNRAHAATMRLFAPEWRGPVGTAANLIEALFDPACLRPAVENFALVGHLVRDRLVRTIAARPTRHALGALLQRIDGFGPLPPRPEVQGLERLSLLLPMVFSRNGVRLSVASTTTTFTAPFDATIQDLQLETFFPTDEASERLLHDLSRVEGLASSPPR